MTAIKKNAYAVIMFLLIMLQLFRVIYVFNVEKEGYHSDEVWCYGLANSYYDPFLFLDGSCFDLYDYDKRQNFDEWLPGSIYKDYIEVSDNDRFAYDSVIYNQSKDQLPPLHYIVLHTICSFFPNTFSMWYGLSINLAMLILTNIILYFFAKLVFNNKNQAILTIILYGLSIGAVQTFMYIRMYAMVTMFVTLVSYLHAKMLLDVKYNYKIWLSLFVATMLGGLTHYVFLFYAFVMAAFFCFYYLFSKKIKRLIFYATAMLAGVGGVVAVFPYAIDQLIGNRTQQSAVPPSRIEIAFVINRAFVENIGIYTPIYHSQTWLYISAILFICLMLACAVIFICRNEEWLHRLKKALAADIKSVWGKKKILKNRRFFFMFVLLIAVFSEIVISSYICAVAAMGLHSDRYLFCAYPCFCLLCSGVVFAIIRNTVVNEKVKKTLMVLSIVIFVILSNVGSKNNYLFPTEREGKSIEEIANGSDVILAITQDWLLVTYPAMLKDTNKVINVCIDDYEFFPEIIKELPDDGKDVYLVLDVSVLNFNENNAKKNEKQVHFLGLPVPSNTYDTQTIDVDYTLDDVVKSVMKVKGIESFDVVGREILFGREMVTYKLR